MAQGFQDHTSFLPQSQLYESIKWGRPDQIQIQLVESYQRPLYGNRISFQSSLDAVECYHNKEIEEHIHDICKRKDAEALEDWRGFYKRKLIGLDKSALEIIQKNSHLIHDDDSRVILRNFLKAVAKQGMAIWLLWYESYNVSHMI